MDTYVSPSMASPTHGMGLPLGVVSIEIEIDTLVLVAHSLLFIVTMWDLSGDANLSRIFAITTQRVSCPIDVSVEYLSGSLSNG
jgi:hypothetical protein